MSATVRTETFESYSQSEALAGNNGWSAHDGYCDWKASNANPNAGTYSAVQQGNGAQDRIIYNTFSATKVSDGYTRFYVRRSHTAGRLNIRVCESAIGNDAVNITFDENDDILYVDSAGVEQTLTTYSGETYYKFEIYWRDSPSQQFKLYIDDGLQLDWHGIYDTFTTGLDRLYFNCEDASPAGCFWYVDDLVVQDENSTPDSAIFNLPALYISGATASISGICVLPALTGTGHTGGIMTADIPSMTAAGYTGGILDHDLPELDCTGTASSQYQSLDIDLPSLECEGTTSNQAQIAMELPALTCAAHTGATASMELPALAFEGTGLAGRELHTDSYDGIELPSITCSATTGMRCHEDIRLPSLEITGTVLAGRNLSSTDHARLPFITISATGSAQNLGKLEQDLPAISLTGTATRHAVATAGIVLPSITSTGTSLYNRHLDISLTLPKLTISATGGYNPAGDLDESLPAFIASVLNRAHMGGRFTDYTLQYSRDG